jgi:hypothetical protein
LKGGITNSLAGSTSSTRKVLGPSPAIKNNRMKILPTHLYSQVSTADNSIEEESKASSGGGSMTLQIQDTYHESRISSIETIEKTLYDITTLFKRFATIV